jgi:hypothetical protein
MSEEGGEAVLIFICSFPKPSLNLQPVPSFFFSESLFIFSDDEDIEDGHFSDNVDDELAVVGMVGE